MDFNYAIKVINKKHRKYKQINKMINNLVEHGIKQRADFLYEYGIGILFSLFEELFNSKVLNKIKYEMSKERDQITLNELSRLFIILLVVFSFLFVVFIIELIFINSTEIFLSFNLLV